MEWTGEAPLPLWVSTSVNGARVPHWTCCPKSLVPWEDHCPGTLGHVEHR